MKRKKADFLTMDNIVLAALVMIVLVVLIIIFKNFLFDTTAGLRNASSDSIAQAKGDRCKTFFGFERVCADSKPADTEQHTYEEIYGDFSDCKQNQKCYERVKKEE